MEFIWICLLFCLWADQVFSLPAGKNITLTQLFSTELADLPDLEKNVKRTYNGVGVHAQQDTVFLGQDATMFRLHRPGFQHVPRSVALESNVHPGLYLRYKNYKFRLEQAKPTGLFEKDATFLERSPFGSDSIALELFTHPGWYVCHQTGKPFTLKAQSKVFRSKDFDQTCVFRQNIRKSSSPSQGNGAKEKEELKAAELLDSLVSKESVGEILAVKNGQKKSEAHPNPMVGTPESISLPLPTPVTITTHPPPVPNIVPKTASFKKMAQGNVVPVPPPPLANLAPPVQLPVINSMMPKALNPPNSPLAYNVPRQPPINLTPNRPPVSFQGNTLAKMFPKPLVKAYNGNPLRNTYHRAQVEAAKIKYLKNLANKNLARMRYNGYVSGIRQQNAGYTTNYFPRRPMYPYPNNVNYRASWRRLGQVGTRRTPLPGSVHPGKVITMSRKAPLTNTASHVARLPKAPPFHFVTVGKVQDAGSTVTSTHSKPIKNENHQLAGISSGSGSGDIPISGSKEPKVIDPKMAVFATGDKCISIRFYNKIRKPVKIISSMKRAGYLVTAETFKLKTIFKHARKDRKVHFYAQDLDDKEDILLNNNNVVTVIPGPCDLPYRSMYLSKNGQFTNQDIEKFLKDEEDKSAAQEGTKKSFSTSPRDGFSQWSAFGPCSASCGSGYQTRSRSCLPKRACLGTTKESRACILAPCVEPANCVQTYGGNSAGKCCAMPFIFQDTVYDKCITHAGTGGLWCATTPNYDGDKSWGFCKHNARRSSLFHRPNSFASSPLPRISYRGLVPSTCPKSCYNMCVPGCHATCCSAHALAFPSVSKKTTPAKTSGHHR